MTDAWWFEPAGGRLKYDDGRAPIKGCTHKIKCEPVLCKSGLHASVRLIDALQYAESNVIWRVKLGGTIVHGQDKCAATERTYLERIKIENELFEFSRWAALHVIHLWGAPAIVREFLETGNGRLRDAAWAAARDEAWAAAWAAARDAARAAARAAAWAAARDAARAAAQAAAWAAARDEARDEAWAAARDAARAAQEAWAAARDAERAAQNVELERLVIARIAK